jgi:hypothetical protein
MIQRKLVEYYVVSEFDLVEYHAKKAWHQTKIHI